jgi:hypothetical protein
MLVWRLHNTIPSRMDAGLEHQSQDVQLVQTPTSQPVNRQHPKVSGHPEREHMTASQQQ